MKQLVSTILGSTLLAVLAGCTSEISVPNGGSMNTPDGVGGGAATSTSGNGVNGTGTNGSGTNGSGTNGSGTTGATTGSGGGGPVAGGAAVLPMHGEPIHTRFVRLTHAQWENSVRDLLRLPDVPMLSTSFAGDPPDGFFSNNERALYVTGTLWGDYQRAAETLSEQVARNASSLGSIGGTGDAAAFIQALGRRAYRRPLTADEQQRYQALFDQGPALFGSGDNFADGAQLVIEAMLQSPNFVYRSELGDDGAQLSGYEIASKLSFLLRNTIPDDALLDAAAGGEFDTLEGITGWAEQMLSDVKAQDTMRIFNAELFGLPQYVHIDKAPGLFPNYSQDVNDDMEESEYLFLNKIFVDGGGLREMLLSQTAFVNSPIAPFYNVNASGAGFTEVDLGPERPGLFTRVGFLAYNGTLRDPDPIRRGVAINHQLLCSELLPPEGVIPGLPEAMPGQTNRERVDAHTGEGTCGAACHARIINPVGFALENFDAVGQIRTMDNGKPVDTSGTFGFHDGAKDFVGALELMSLMAADSVTHACYSARLAEFALSRDLNDVDRPLVSSLENISMSETSSIKEILFSIIRNPAFTTRNGGL